MIDPSSAFSPLAGFRRIRLRDPRPEDAQRIYRWRAERAAREHQPITPIPVDQLRLDLERTATNKLPDYSRDRFQWMIEQIMDRTPVGWITLSIRSWEHQIGEIGYTLSEDYQGRGYGTQAVEMVLDKSFFEAHLYRIEAKCSVHNRASAKLLEKTGFSREGIMRGYFNIRGERVDHYLYAILRTEYSRKF